MCRICEQGLIRIAHCASCHATVAICDECEAIWKEPRWLKMFSPPPDTQHPTCPRCGEPGTPWEFPDGKDLEAEGLCDLVEGESV